MCGIAGVLGGDQGEAAEKLAHEMIGRIAHRGPNGIRVEQLPGATLAHARLSIIDLEGGWQPLQAAGSTIIGNGEIYNYVELTEEFGLKSKLSTGSDFEPLLHLYALEGEKAFQRLRGMYAFCLIGGDGRTWLVRDPFGIKPLYTEQIEGKLTFSSEARHLHYWKKGLGPQGAVQLLTLGYQVEDRGASPSPGACPGAVMEFRDGGLHGPNPLLEPIKLVRSAGDQWALLRQLDAVLEDSVRVHQRSDVPYGLFLSGGIDSSAIATLMARLNERPVTAFTCGFDTPETYDERRAAEKVARALNLDWREVTFTQDDFWRIAPEVASALDEPTTDYACLPTYKLAEAAKDDLTVVLSGEGGDELFAGYGRYRRGLRLKWLGGRPAEPQIDAPFLKPGLGRDVARLMPDLAKLPYSSREPMISWREAACLGRPDGMTELQTMQWADIATWLPNDLLLKLDRMLMAHGLEGRTPFLDREVAAFAFNLPDRMKVRGRYGKWLLRKWLERACPAAEPWARKKGFTVPVAGWIAPRAADIGPRVAACEGLGDVCDLDAVRAVFTDDAQSKNRWPLVFYALWWSIHVGGASKAEAADAVFGA